MGSTRLPGKVLLDLAGEPVLARVVQRTARARMVDEVVVATTTDSKDSQIVDLCEERGWSYSRGSEADVLDRYVQAAKGFRADAVVRITSDCPAIDPEVIDLVVRAFLESQPSVDYASNGVPPQTYPRGMVAEVVGLEALCKAHDLAEDESSREHVTLFVYRHPEMFKIRGVYNSTDLSPHRWTLDTPEDLELLRLIFNSYPDDTFSWHQVVQLLAAHPEWRDLNRHVVQKSV